VTRASIVAAADFSPGSDRALRLAAALAARRSARLVLVHVGEPPLLGAVVIEPVFIPPQLLEVVRRRHEHAVDGQLAYAADRLRDAHPGLEVATHVHLGDTVPGLLESVREQGADLVVMATHGAGLSRLLFGSVTAGVAAAAPVPVLVADRDEGAEPNARFGRVLAAVDGSGAAGAVVQAAAAMVAPGGALELAEVVPGRGLWPRGRDADEPVAEAEASVRLAALRPLAGAASTTMWIGHGEPGTALLDRAARGASDLIVIGAHGAHRAERTLGSVATRVLGHATCALLIVPTTGVHAAGRVPGKPSTRVAQPAGERP
jgi:nucleotide-binding universal stress UspA family protein